MKTKILVGISLLVCLSLFSFSPLLSGEPVPGAEILIEQEPNDIPIQSVKTNQDGEFEFTFPDGMKIPKSGTFKITITPPKNLKGSIAKKIKGVEKQTIEIPFTRKDGPKFKYVLIWDDQLKTNSNRGGFAVSGRNNT
jgi:hypothetical protein